MKGIVANVAKLPWTIAALLGSEMKDTKFYPIAINGHSEKEVRKFVMAAFGNDKIPVLLDTDGVYKEDGESVFLHDFWFDVYVVDDHDHRTAYALLQERASIFAIG